MAGYSAASIARIDLYKVKTKDVLKYVKLIAGAELHDLNFWREARKIYGQLIDGHNNFEIAETFFNSVYCAVFKHRKIRDEYAFVFSPHGDMPPADVSKVYRTYRLEGSLSDLLHKLLTDFAFSIPYENLARDIDNIREAILGNLACAGTPFFPQQGSLSGRAYSLGREVDADRAADSSQ